MFSNKFRKGAGRVAVFFATTALLATGVAPAQASDATPLYLSFEANDTLGAPAANQAFEDGAASIAASDNLTGQSLKFVKGGTKAWSGVNVILSPATTAHLADADLHTITFDYWSNDADPTPVMVVLETSVPSYMGGPKVAKAVTAQPGLNQLSFDMSTGVGWNAATEWVTLVIFPNFAADDTNYSGATPAAVTGQTYEIDNVSVNGGTIANVVTGGNEGGRAATSTSLTFESSDALGALAVGAADGAKPQGGFEGLTTSIDDAPAGGNGGKALKMVKEQGAQTYAGVVLVKFAADTRVTNGTHKVITLNYYSAKANSTVSLELRGFPNALGTTATATKVGWQTLTFDFTDVAGWSPTEEYDAITLFPDFGVAGDSSTYFVDNVAFNGATTPAIVVPRAATSTVLTFEASDTLGALAVGDASAEKAAGGFEGLSTSIADAPAGGNGGKVLKMVKNNGAKTYAGVNLVKFVADTRVTNGTNKVVTMNYYSAKANSTVRLEVRPYPAAVGVNVTATKVGWQTLTFDFTSAAGWSADTEFGDLTLFPDFDVAGANTTYYVDNVAFNGATTPAIPTVAPAVKPAVRVAATVAGTAKVGKTLTAGKGSWTGTATISYTYKWYRCSVVAKTAGVGSPSSSAKCSTISGATKSAYKLAKADIGKYVRVLVTAKNSKGSSYSLSKTTSVKVAK